MPEQRDSGGAEKALTRRTVGRGTAMLGAAIATASLAGCAPAAREQKSGAAFKPADYAEIAPSGYDFIIVGSGAGGGPLAANLARAGRKVLLIEAGDADAGGLDYTVPAFHAASTDDPAMQWNYFVRHWANPPLPDSKYVAAQRGVWYPRAGTLGGCTAHNAMITVYPDNADWDGIAAATGDASWSSANMRRYFQRLESCRYRPRWRDFLSNVSGHGYDGWLPTSEADPHLVLRDRKLIEIVHAAADEVGFADVIQNLVEGMLDPNDIRANVHQREGMFLTPLAVENGARFGSRDYIAATARDYPRNLTVLTRALVTRVLFDGTKAVGVEYLAQSHAYEADPNSPKARPSLGVLAPLRRTVGAGEVVLAAGAFNSPQLLMLSGIGPRAHLAEHSIPLVADRPGVGLNLQDRYEIGVVSRFPAPFALIEGCTLRPPRPGEAPDPCFAEWSGTRGGPYATNGVVVGIVRRARPNRPAPDLYIFGFPGAFRGYYPGWSADASKLDHFTWAILKAHTNNNAGQVRLRSGDPRDTPDILFRYFDEGNDARGEDLDSVVAGVEFVRRLNRRIANLDAVEVVPGPSVTTSSDIAAFVRREAWGHHASCSNKMGPASDPLAVVDSAFRVHGVQNLRIVDASVFPRIPGFFIAAAIYMIAEKASDVLLQA
jgi:choline dehydrogenase